MGRKKKGKKSSGGGGSNRNNNPNTSSGAPPPSSIPQKEKEEEKTTVKTTKEKEEYVQKQEPPPKHLVVDDALATVLVAAAADTATSTSTSVNPPPPSTTPPPPTTTPTTASTAIDHTVTDASVAISSAAATACCNIFEGIIAGDDDDDDDAAAAALKKVSKSIVEKQQPTKESSTANTPPTSGRQSIYYDAIMDTNVVDEEEGESGEKNVKEKEGTEGAAAPLKKCCSSSKEKDDPKEEKQKPPPSSSKSNESCCSSKEKSSEASNTEQATTTTTTTEQTTTTTTTLLESPPKKKGSCCSKKSTQQQQQQSQQTFCMGCGDNCKCCIENGWSYCQCGPNCRCSNPLMAEQASLILESTGQNRRHHHPSDLPPSFHKTSTTTTTTRRRMMEDPLLSPSNNTTTTTTTADNAASASGAVVPDLEANNSSNSHNRRPLFVDIVVGGMTCTMCSQAITRALSGMDGIIGVTVSLSTDVAHVEIDPYKNDNNQNYYAVMVEEIQNMIADIGYMVVDVIPMPNKSLDIVVVDPTTTTTTTTGGGGGEGTTTANGDNNNELSPMLANNDIENNNNNNNNADGYGDNNTQQDRWNRIAQRQEEKLFQRKRAFLLSLIGTIPILLLTMILPHILPRAMRWWEHHDVHIFNKSIPLESLLLWLLATPVQFVCGWEFYKSSYYGLFRTGTMGMDVLVVLGTTASYGYALYATLSDQMKESHFFETSAVLICFVLLGKWMQALAVHRTSDALSQLMQLQPSTAIRVTPIHDADDGGVASSSGNDDWDPMQQPYREEVIPTKQLNRGDIVKIVPGASLPADGIVLAGELSVDESMVTGESLPVLKTKNSVVLGGTVCVESSGRVDEARPASNVDVTEKAGQVAFCQVTGVGSSTALAQIIQLVSEAQASKVPMQNFADSVSAIFVPVVASLSIITFLVWYALCSSGVVPEDWYTNMNEDPATFSLMFGIACLVISCPCALGLATPTAVMVGTGMGAQLGILMKGGEALEAASKVNAVVLDKTGTLTTGKPVVTDFILLKKGGGGGCCSSKIKKDAPSMADGKPLSRETILWLLGSLERSSEHPLAKAIVSYVEEELSVKKKGPSYLEEKPFLQPNEFRSMTGRGASGYLQADGNDANRYFVAVGNRAFFASLEVELTAEIDDQMKELEEQGKTAILAAINYQFYVILGVADELKPDAAAAVAYLRNEMKIEVWMVTGDNARTAQAIARQLDLPSQRVVSEALPNAKVHQVKKLQQQGKTVAHVGDGINDSPALAQANVGISVGTGAAIAAEASDMVLVRGQVADVCAALDLCRVIFARIQWNFLWSLVYNCLGIPLAAGVSFPIFHTRLPPTVAALAMALSSVSVVFSSLALRLYESPNLENYSARSVGTSMSSSGGGAAETATAPPAISAASNTIAASSPPPPPPPLTTTNGRGPQLVTSLSLDLGPGPSSELAQPLLANQHVPDIGPQDMAAVSMEEGSQPSL